MFHLPDIDQTLSRFDSRLDKLERDMSQMVVLLKHIDTTMQHIDTTLVKLIQIQEAQLAASVSYITEKDILL